MVGLGRHMRAHYVARWSNSRRSNLRYVSGRVAVAVREDTTLLAEKPTPPTYETVRDSCDGVTHHLRAQLREALADRVVRQMVQPHAIYAAMLQSGRRNRVAGRHELRTQSGQRSRLLVRWDQGNCNRPLHGVYRTMSLCQQGGIVKTKERHFLLGLNAEVSVPKH